MVELTPSISNHGSMEKHAEKEVDKESQPVVTESAGGPDEISTLKLLTIILALVLSLFLVDHPRPGARLCSY